MKPTELKNINCGKRIPPVTAIDLFCGAGGLTYGLRKAGIDVRMGIDIDPACEYPYTMNNKTEFLMKSVEDIGADELRSALTGGKYNLLAGCAPCQTFSRYNQKADSDDKRWWLLDQFSRLVSEVAPELVTMENVPGLIYHQVFKDFVCNLERAAYDVHYEIVDCAEYGIPQNRRRLVLLASTLGSIRLLNPKELRVRKKTVRDAIGEMPALVAGEAYIEDQLHQCCGLSPLNLQRIRASSAGGSWRDWDEDMVADCHKKATGKTYGSVYGRMSWDEPAPTITTQFFGFGNGRFGHPEQDRALSLREGAMLQGFPKRYKFVPPGQVISKKSVGRLIGNAVPVGLAETIGKSIVVHLQEVEGGNL